MAIVNTDKRVIAGACRLAREPLMNDWNNKVQRGFLKGLFMLMNVLEIDEKAMTVSLKKEYGRLVLFDFKAAFPSIAHELLLQSLEHLGLAEGAINVTRAL